MFQWLLLAIAVTGVASLARGRGGKPLFWGALTIVAFVLGAVVAHSFGPESVMQLVLPWVFVGVVASNVRFVVGASRAKPDSIWSCPNCNMVNESSYVVCQACQRPWTE